jgi:hypothetical protein
MVQCKISTDKFWCKDWVDVVPGKHFLLPLHIIRIRVKLYNVYQSHCRHSVLERTENGNGNGNGNGQPRRRR